MGLDGCETVDLGPGGRLCEIVEIAVAWDHSRQLLPCSSAPVPFIFRGINSQWNMSS